MLDPTLWPDWFQVARLLGTVAVTAAFGAHAYGSHVKEAVAAVSSRKWMYWIYSVVFVGATIANFTQLCISVVLQSYPMSSFNLGYGTLLLVLSYLALLAGVLRKS